MKVKVHPMPRNQTQSQISSTSRHQLKQLRENDSSMNMQISKLYLSNIKLKFFISQLIKKLKFLTPPSHKPDSVLEQWETDLNNLEAQQSKKKPELFKKQTLSEEMINRYSCLQLINVMKGILIIVFLWLVTVSFSFQIKILPQVFMLVIATCIIQLVLKVKITWKEHDHQNTYQIYWIEDYIDPWLILIAALFMTIRHYIQVGGFQYVLAAYQITFMFIQWPNIGKYFAFLTHYAEQYKKRKQLRIIELFCFTLVMAHIFAIIMYSMTYFCPQNSNTWIKKANLQGQPWYILYIYSYYWANTTMVTVGYGDLAPTNFVEAIIVTLIQIVGTAIFGYMINVIGITVNQIQKKTLQFEQHQSTILKLKEHYQLSRQLCYKMKNDIKKKQSQMKETPLKNNEERQFLDYIDSSLKDQFVLETNMKVIKKSIFFLTHFTVNFQNQIALKLIRCIYKPDQVINFQQNGEKQLVIINNGKVNIFSKKIHNNHQFTKVARVIKPQQGKPTLNVFGYSSLILNKSFSLKAVTEETATAYILRRSDILESIGKSMLDFQSFNQLREKMLQCVCLEQVEAPSLKEQQQHFRPNLYLLLKKIKHQKQERKQISRGERRIKRYVITLKHYQNKTMLYIPHSHEKQSEEMHYNSFLDIEDKADKKNQGEIMNFSESLIIDQGKNFENFLKNCNLNVISGQYEKFCLRKSYKRKMQQFTHKKSSILMKSFKNM